MSFVKKKKKKKQAPANAEILREQIQLMQTETELKKSLETIKDHINKLLVSVVFFSSKFQKML